MTRNFSDSGIIYQRTGLENWRKEGRRRPTFSESKGEWIDTVFSQQPVTAEKPDGKPSGPSPPMIARHTWAYGLITSFMVKKVVASIPPSTAAMPDPLSVELFLIAPDPVGERGVVLSHAAKLAEMLNGDEGLSPDTGKRVGSPPETAESILSFTQQWCLEKNASTYVILLDHRLVIGSISLSHVDPLGRTARTGYFIGSRYQNRGYGALALARLLDLAGRQGLSTVSGTVPASNYASRRIWEKSGFPLRFAGDEVTAVIGAGEA